jgi:hypothetical protein
MQRWPSILLLVLLAGCATTPPKPTTNCADFQSYKDGQSIKGKLTIDRFTFGSGGEAPIEFRDAGAAGGPSGTIGLRIKDHLYVAIDEALKLFEVTYISNSEQPIRFETYAPDATIYDSRTFAALPQHTPLVQPLPEGKPTKLLGFYDDGGEGLLTKVCVTH